MKWALRILASLLVAGALLTMLMLWGGVSPWDVLETLRRLPAWVYFIALALHLCTYGFRALRFRLLIPEERRPTFRRAFVIALSHNMASYILPAKTGEASFVVYLKLQCDVAPSTGLAALFVSRFLDGATLCFGLALTCIWLERSHPALEWLGSLAALLAVLTVVFLMLSFRGDLVVRGIESMLRWMRLHQLGFGERLLVRTNSLALALRTAGGGRRLFRAALLGIPIWFTVFGFFTLLVRSMGMPETVGFAETTFAACLGMMFNLLPINAAGGIGTQELGWVAAFHEFLGVDYDVALSTSIGVHFIQLFNIVVLGLVGHLAMGMLPRLRFEDED